MAHFTYSYLAFIASMTANLILPQLPSGLVTAQSFGLCYPTDDLTNQYSRTWSISPVMTQIETTLGPKSHLTIFCGTCTSFPPTAPCKCSIWVSEGGSEVPSAYCNSCDLLSLTETSFEIYWDCTNLVTNDCAAFNEVGCYNNLAEPEPEPSPISNIKFPNELNLNQNP